MGGGVYTAPPLCHPRGSDQLAASLYLWAVKPPPGAVTETDYPRPPNPRATCILPWARPFLAVSLQTLEAPRQGQNCTPHIPLRKPPPGSRFGAGNATEATCVFAECVIAPHSPPRGAVRPHPSGGPRAGILTHAVPHRLAPVGLPPYPLVLSGRSIPSVRCFLALLSRSFALASAPPPRRAAAACAPEGGSRSTSLTFSDLEEPAPELQ